MTELKTPAFDRQELEAFTVWATTPPPPSTWVYAIYVRDNIYGNPWPVKTCKRGCCVTTDWGDSLRLPTRWKLIDDPAPWEQKLQNGYLNHPPIKIEDYLD